MRDKVTRQCPETTTFEEKGERKRIRTSAYQPNALRASARRSSFERTREGHRQSDKHWNCFWKGSFWETGWRAYGHVRAHRYHLEPNSLEAVRGRDDPVPVEDGTAAPVTDQHVSVRVNVVDLLDAHLVQHTKQTTPLSKNTHNYSGNNNNREFIERFQRLKALYDLLKQKHAMRKYPHKSIVHKQKTTTKNINKHNHTKHNETQHTELV